MPSISSSPQEEVGQSHLSRSPTGLEFLSRGAYVPLFLSPNPPPLMIDARPISSRFPLRRESGAHRFEIGPLLLTYFFSEGT